MDDRQEVGSFVFSWAHSPAADRAAADISRNGCPWPEASRAGLNAGAHAVKACALPFRAGWDRSRSPDAGDLQPGGLPDRGAYNQFEELVFTETRCPCCREIRVRDP